MQGEKAARWHLAVELWQEMPEKVEANLHAFNSTISACEKAAQWPQALVVFDALPKASLSPDVVSFSAVISAFEKGRPMATSLICLADLARRTCAA